MSIHSPVAGLRRQEDVQEAVLSAMGEAVMLFDPGGALLYANPAAASVLELIAQEKGELLPHRLRDLLAGTDSPVRQSAIRQVELPDRLLEATAFPADPPGSLVVTVRDITEVRGVERLRRDFVANASHELKTPVASILALAETLRAAARDPAASSRLLARLEQEALRLASLVRDLLALSRLEAGSLPNLPLDFRWVVDAECARMQAHAEAAGLRLKTVLGGETLVLTGSESDLTRMVHNLLDNAIRYTTKGGVVKVTLRRTHHHAQLAVSDTGVGIPKEDLTRVFERFYRVDTARSRQTGGTGLGLSIVRNVAQAHGGDVEVNSRLGDGSTFTVRLPIRITISDQTPADRRGNGSPDRER